MTIFQITQVNVIKTSSSPLKLEIHASGLAATSGWTDPKLDPAATTPEDTILEFNFDAKPPSDISLPVLTPIQAATAIEPPDPVSAITVIGRTNRITIHASQFTQGTFTTFIFGEESVTTHIAGEETFTTLIAGEETFTTFIFGEEHHVTSWIVGEEHPTTLVAGEESATNPQLDDPLGTKIGTGGPFGAF